MGHTPVWANPDVLYAAPTASGNGDCSAWAHACTLQTALTNAVSGDEIWVKAGVHYPGSNRADTFTLKNGVEVYGGFAGTETSRNQRNWQSNPTILSGDIDQNDNHGGDFINENTGQIVGSNAYHVLTGSGTNGSAVLDGFIITAGQANGSGWPADYGGGMLNVSGSPTLVNLRFSGNFAQAAGGGMYNNGSGPTLTNVTFQGNSAGQYYQIAQLRFGPNAVDLITLSAGAAAAPSWWMMTMPAVLGVLAFLLGRRSLPQRRAKG